MSIFIDTNVFIRHLTQDHSEHSRRATAFLARVERGEVKGQTANTVVFEAVFTLERHYRTSKAVIRSVLLPLIELPTIVVSGKPQLRRAFDLYVDKNMSFGDAYHVAVMEHLGITKIATFDRGYDRVSNITRVDPS